MVQQPGPAPRTGWQRLFPRPAQASADPVIAASVRVRWAGIARDLGTALVVVPAIAAAPAIATLITAPVALMWWMLPLYLLVVVGAHGAAVLWVRGRLWPPGPWGLAATAYLAPIVVVAGELAVAARAGDGSWGPVWPVFAGLLAAVGSGLLAQSARKKLSAIDAARLAESTQEIVFRVQTYEHRYRFGEDPKRHGIHNVQVAMAADMILVRAHDRLGPKLSAYPPQITPLLRIELRSVTGVSVRHSPPQAIPYRWFHLPDGRPMEATEPTAVVVTTVVPGLSLTIPTLDAELIAETIRRRIRWYAGQSSPRRY